MELEAEPVSLQSISSTVQDNGAWLASGQSFDAGESGEPDRDQNRANPPFPQGQLLVAQLVHAVYALPQPVQQVGSRTEVQVPAGDSESPAPKMKGMPISHFQNEDASFWASSVKRVQPSSLRVYRI